MRLALSCECGEIEQFLGQYSHFGAPVKDLSRFEALCHKELFRIIGETLSEMPALQQEVFLDIHMEGQTYLEVAKARNITKHVVEYQLRKAERTIGCSLQRMYG